MTTTQPSSIQFSQLQFITSCATLGQLPVDISREVALAGRSNSGKSSLINAISSQKKLAKSSSTPGRTQLLNYFGWSQKDYALVDMPGYGFATAPIKVKNQWQSFIDVYLYNRKVLQAVMIIMDARRPFTSEDVAFITKIENLKIAKLFVLNKADKLNQSERAKTINRTKEFANNHGAQWLLTSVLKNEGLVELKAWLSGQLQPSSS